MKPTINSAADYIACLILDSSRRQCIRYWKDRYGDMFVAELMAVIKQKSPKIYGGLA